MMVTGVRAAQKKTNCDPRLFTMNGMRYVLRCRLDNGNLPNTTWIWDNYRSNVSDIACRLSPSDVCVKYTYKYNHAGE